MRDLLPSYFFDLSLLFNMKTKAYYVQYLEQRFDGSIDTELDTDTQPPFPTNELLPSRFPLLSFPHFDIVLPCLSRALDFLYQLISGLRFAL